MTSLFRRARGKEPPSTGNFHHGSRKRQPVDPPPSLQISRAVDPNIRPSGGRLEMIEKLSRAEYQQRMQSEAAVQRRPAAEVTDRREAIRDDEQNENIPVNNMLQAQAQAQQMQARKQQPLAASSSFGATSISSRNDRPFTTKSNKEGMSKNLAVASKLEKDSRATAGRSSVFRDRKKRISDNTCNDTVASIRSTRSAVTTTSAATATSTATATATAISRNTRKANAAAATGASDHDRAALRKLLGTRPTETKPSPPAPSTTSEDTTNLSKSTPNDSQSSKPSTSAPPSGTDTTFDQKEYLRGLISSKKVAQKTTSATATAITASRKNKSAKAALATEVSEKGKQQAMQSTSESGGNPAANGTSTRSNTSASSSVSAEQKAILRKVLAKTITKKNGEEKARRKLSPKNTPSNLESAAVSLSRKVLSEQSKPLSPKKPSSMGLTLKGYVRSKMGLSKKSNVNARLQAIGSDTNRHYDSNIAKSSSSDSAEASIAASSAASSSQSISRVASLSSDASDDDKTKTTLGSSSQESQRTKHSYETSLKGLSTAETIDTDESSTIMGNLQLAPSSDSMQYSSEEGSNDNTMNATTAFKAIDNLSRVPPGQHAQQSRVGHSQQSKPLVEKRENNGNSDQNHSKPQTQLMLSTRNQEDESYAKFHKFHSALKAEASGAHSQLWSSFQAVMTGYPRRAPPSRDGVSQFRFDEATRQMLADMNSHLKGRALVECVTATQLVNDKKFAKEVALGLTAKPVFVPSIKEGLPNEDRQQASVDKDHRRLPQAQQREAKPISEAPRSQPQAIAQHHPAPGHQSSQDTVSNKVSNNLAQERACKEGIETEQNVTEALTKAKPQSTLSTNRPLPGSSPSKKDGTVPWSGVRLRAVSNTDTPSTATVEDEDQSKQELPWANVKLRRVPLDEKESFEREQGEQDQMQANDFLESEASQDGLENASADALKPPERSRDTGTSDQSSGADNSASAALPYFHRTPDSDQAPEPIPRNITPIESACEASAGGHLVESVSMFAIKSTSGDSSAGSLIESTVAIDKAQVMMLQSSAGDSEDTVAWTVPRDRIKSLKLDMESMSVSLSLVDCDESKVLSFMTSPDCLRFANAFYEMRKPSQEQESSKPSQPSNEDAKESNHMESLNPEEQQVLESYRQARRTKPAKDALRTVVPIPSPQTNGKDPIIDKALQKAADPSSASSSVNTVKLPLSEDDMKAAESYKKMLKLHIPPEAVQHKMTKDGVDPKIAGFVLGPTGILAADTKCPDGFSDSERQVTMLYRNMLKLMVPRDTLRNRMKEDKIEEKIVFAVLGQDQVVEKKTEDATPKLSIEEEAKATKYRKMLKMMIPKDAVRHKMMQDQVDPKIVQAVVGGDKPAEDVDKLTPDEEATAATYRKMLKLMMPPEAVRHRMNKEGVSSKIVKAVLGQDDSNKAGAATGAKTKAAARGSKLVSLHWTPLSGTELDNSVWGAGKKGKVKVAKAEGSDISKLVELFQKKTTTKNVKGKSGSGDGDKGTGKAKLLDLNRANIIAISLKAFKDFSHEELARMLQNLDPSHKLSGERVQFVKDLLPTATEINTIKRYYGGPDRLVPAELWFQKIVHIKRLEAKAHVLHTMEIFENEVTEIQESLHLLTRVCNQVMESERLRELLDMVLQIGNIMNEGTRTGGASGFKFDSLLRLTQTKSGDGKTTVLDYMVTIYVAKGQRQTLNLIEDFPDCQVASRMLISDLVSNVKDVQEKLQKCKQEYDALMDQTSNQKESSSQSRTPGKANKAGGDPRLQLLSAITSRGAGAEDPKDNLLAAIKAKTPAQSNPTPIKASSDQCKPKPIDPGLQAGITRLNEFLSKAEQIYKSLTSDRDQAVNTCREMSKYCGEGDGERSTDGLLGILSQFASNLEAAVAKHDRMMQAEAKKQSRQKMTPKKQRRKPEDLHGNASPSKQKPSPLKAKKNGKESKQVPRKQRQSPGKGTSLVLMVNELLKEANEQTKKDFSQGIVYDDPDAKLQAIYDREKKTSRAGAPPLPTGRRPVEGDILTRIKKRQGEADGVAAKAKRTQLERVIDCINCASGPEDATDSPSNSSTETLSDHSDHSDQSQTNNSNPEKLPLPEKSSQSFKRISDKPAWKGDKKPWKVDLQRAQGNNVSTSKSNDINGGKKTFETAPNKPGKESQTPTSKLAARTAKTAGTRDKQAQSPCPAKKKEAISNNSSPAVNQQQATAITASSISSKDTSGEESAANKPPDHQVDKFADLQSKWKQCKDDSSRRLSTTTPTKSSAMDQSSHQDDEGSVDRPICLVGDDDAVPDNTK